MPRRQTPCGLSSVLQPQLVGSFLMPFEGAFGAVDAEGESVFVSCRNEREPHATECAVFVLQRDVRVIERLSPRRQDRHVGRHGDRELAGDEVRHLVGVRADFAEDGVYPHELRPKAPVPLVALWLLDQERSGGEIALDLTNRADRALFHQRPGFPHHRIARIAMGQGEEPAAAGDRLFEGHGFLEGAGHRLFADDVDAAFHKERGDLGVKMRRGGDRHHLQAVFARRLRHVAVVLVRALRIDKAEFSRLARNGGIDRHGAGNQLIPVVEPRAHSVDFADQRVDPATHHAPADPPCEGA